MRGSANHYKEAKEWDEQELQREAEKTNNCRDNYPYIKLDYSNTMFSTQTTNIANVSVPDENGIRAILNYGHSFGHVIENLCGYGKFLHGEAISIGMNIAGKIAIEKGLWSKEELETYKSKDPIQIVYDEIIKKKVASDKELEEINKKVIENIKEAAEFALQSPFPKKEDLYTDVYL